MRIAIYCYHDWDIDFSCESGCTAKCKRCGSIRTGKATEFMPGSGTPKQIGYFDLPDGTEPKPEADKKTVTLDEALKEKGITPFYSGIFSFL